MQIITLANTHANRAIKFMEIHFSSFSLEFDMDVNMRAKWAELANYWVVAPRRHIIDLHNCQLLTLHHSE
jgi:hypothetical protein